jgi:glycosyltransferase involved in cell wall biosynthesis
VKRYLFERGVSPRRIAVIYNGVDVPFYASPSPGLVRSELLAGLGLPADGARRFVTLVANMRHEVKDQPMFLRAARRVRESVPESAFILAGEGERVESLRGLAAELGLGQSVFFTGRCERVPDLLAVSDVCVLSSKAEGFSNSILEYMAAARPVVVTDVGGAREAVVEGETGYIVPSGDYEEMAARIASLLLDPQRARRMGECGQEVVREKFSAEAQFRNTHALYERLLGGDTL